MTSNISLRSNNKKSTGILDTSIVTDWRVEDVIEDEPAAYELG